MSCGYVESNTKNAQIQEALMVAKDIFREELEKTHPGLMETKCEKL